MIILPEDIDPNLLPVHVAIIMDGNGRWATRRGLRRSKGHRKGAERVHPIVDACRDIGIKHVTLYAFSSENWKRSAFERNFLWRLLAFFIRRELRELRKKGVKLRFIGDIEPLPGFARSELLKTVKETENNTDITLTLALNYGGRGEIIRAVKKWYNDVREDRVTPEDLDESTFASYLDTADIPDPDLLIRTAGEQRISNFLLYQSSYAEFYFTETLWPDFTEETLFSALRAYQKRVRRIGGVPVEEESP